MAEAHPLGRRPFEDMRDLGHLMRLVRPEAFAQTFAQLPDEVYYRRGPILNQEMTSCCVEFSLENKLRAQPVMVGQSRLPPRYAVYDEAIQIDEFQDNDNDTARRMGTSVRAGCQALQRRGLISSYNWAYTVEDVMMWILSGQGGVVLGIDWHEGMDAPDAEGIIRLKGDHRGGHAIYCYGGCWSKGFAHLFQSWGDWGGWKVRGRRVNIGCCKLPLEDLRQLFRGNAEACTIIETPYRRIRGTTVLGGGIA